MSRMLCASGWMLISLGLCSCAQETGTPAAPAPAGPAPAAAPDANVDSQQPTPQNVDRQMTGEDRIRESQANPETELHPMPAASSGNPVVDFFRAVDRGVKSTAPEEKRPESSEPGDGE